ncbi:hypothetical protein H2200_003996 [Cladophialophora chaetospira]|uniref:Zn(2)-C6 fungal-type domain-containing protein n=1 Tax=Cladophialophora chaetospira TaxID=386627 RepID=A0AA38XG18_9EURO|nr:hypothetical protein H2200_003996 [Cladophialophora chaetospira]
MAAPMLLQFVADGPPKRTRKLHNKVKTGCQTCKIRKKKCDEAKPFCNRCTSTGRKCDGYETVRSEANIAKPRSEARDPSLQLWRPPDTNRFQNGSDYYCFEFFRHRTGPDIAAYFDSSIWRTFTLRACLLHPTVLQAAIAVGAVHRRFELGISPEAFTFCDIANRQYWKALKCLEEDLKSGHPLGAEINMVASMLLCIFEVFQGNDESAIAHYKSGLTLLIRQNGKVKHTETHRQYVNLDYAALRKFTDRLEHRAPQLFGTPTAILYSASVKGSFDPIPEVFTSLEQARDVIITEGQHIWHSWAQLELGNLKGFSTQQLHVSRLLEWSKAYADYSKSARGRSRPASRQPYLLKAYREALYLVILTQLAFHVPDGQAIEPLCFLPETCDCHTVCRVYSDRKRALSKHFARVMLVTESLFHDDSSFAYQDHSINLDSGIGPPLKLGSETCTSTKVRYQATSLLPEGELRQKVWNKMGVYNIAEKLGSIEEHAVVTAAAIPAAPWVDVTCFLEARKMIVRHCKEDEFGGLIWTQECISY